MCLLLSDTLNSSLIKQKFIIKQPEKAQRTASVQNRAALVEPPVKRHHQLRSKAVKAKQEKELPNHEKSKHEKIVAAVPGSTKGKENAKVGFMSKVLSKNLSMCFLMLSPAEDFFLIHLFNDYLTEING